MDNLEANIMDKSMRSVFVGNIPYEATEEKLKDIFGEVGQVLSFKLVFDRETGKPKGYGFCEYRDQETALSAMRNLNGYEIGGRNLRVDNACTEKSRMEMQNLLNQPPVENPYGEPIQAEKAPEAISKAVASLPPEQMFELMKQMKLCIQNNPTEARQMLLQNPQLAYALLQAQVVMRIIDPHTACSLLHPQQPVPTTLMPSDKPAIGSVPINNNFTPTPVQPPRQEFQPVPAPTIHNNVPPTPVFVPQDVDLRSLGGVPDPRMTRMGDQDMRTLPAPIPNPIPPVPESFIREPLRDPREPLRDPREPQRDPREPLRDPREPLRDPREPLRDPREPLRDPREPLRDPREPLRDPREPLRDPREPPRDPREIRDPRDPRAAPVPYPADPRQAPTRMDPRQKPMPTAAVPSLVPPQPVRPPILPPLQPPVAPAMAPRPAPAPPAGPSIGPAGASDQEKAALIMQVLQLSDEQIAMLPPEQRNSILVLKEQIAKSAHR